MLFRQPLSHLGSFSTQESLSMPKNAALARSDVEHIARLAKLDLKGEALDAMTAHLEKILDAVSTLSELNTESVTPYHLAAQEGTEEPLRGDEIQASLDPREALANAPEKGPLGFKVPPIHD